VTGFSDREIGGIFSWKEINSVHKTYNGIYQRGGELISLLTDFGKINPCYPDFEGEDPDTIFYTGAGRRGDQKLDVKNQAMHNAIKTERIVPLFCKVAVNQWKFMGYWQVIDAEYIYEEKNERNVWSFVLNRIAV
jgi:hypothetical protein